MCIGISLNPLFPTENQQVEVRSRQKIASDSWSSDPGGRGLADFVLFPAAEAVRGCSLRAPIESYVRPFTGGQLASICESF